MPWARKFLRSFFLKASSRIRATIITCLPRVRAGTAWLVPLVPKLWVPRTPK